MPDPHAKAIAAKLKAVLTEYKAGNLMSGSGKKVTSRRQAMAIALEEAKKKAGDAKKKSYRSPMQAAKDS